MPFQPFPQRCLTCGTQFRVTKPDLVGQILACPKCASMLQILAPENAGDGPAGANPLAVGDEAVDSDAVTQGSSIVSEAGDWETVTPAGSISKHRFEIDETVPLDQARRDQNIIDASAQASTELGDPYPGPPVDFESGRAAKRRQVALVAFTLLSGLCIAGLLFVMFVRSWNGRTVADKDGASAISSAMSVDDSTPPRTQEQDILDPGLTVDGTDDQVSINTTEDVIVDPPVADMSSDDVPEDLLPTDLDSAETSDEDVSNGDDASPEMDAPQQTPEKLTELPKEFSEAYAPFVFDLAQSSPGGPPDIDSSVVSESVDLDQAAALGMDPMMIANPPEPIEYRSSMALPFRIKAKNGYPLSDLVLLLSQLTTVPIELDWLSFDLAGVDVAKRIEFDTDQRSVEGHLAVALSQFGGVLRREETVLRVTIDEATFDQAYKNVVATDDFVGGQESARVVLAEFLADEVDTGEAAAVEPKDGTDEAQPEEAQPGAPSVEDRVRESAKRRFAMVVTESLRRMRGLPGRLSDRTMQRWIVDLDKATVDPKANGQNAGVWPVVEDGEPGNQPIEALPMAQWIRELARRNDATCLVHWSDATQRMMSPAQLVLPHTGDGFASMVTTTLEPFGVQIREVSPGKWWMGTEARHDRLPAVAWTPAMTADQRQAMLRKLNAAIGGLSRNDYRVVHDPVSDRLLLMVPRFVLAQMDKFL